MTDKLQGRSSLIIKHFMCTHISSVPVSNTRIHLTDWPQKKSGIHFPKHMRCRPKICHRMHFLFTLFSVPPGTKILWSFNPLHSELYPICYLLALLGAHHFFHVSRIRVKSLTLRLLMSYIYGAPILDVSRPHTTTHHSR